MNIKKIKVKLPLIKKIAIALIIGGILLIFLSGMLPEKKSSSDTVSEDKPEAAELLEKRLSETLSGIKGAGRTEVMISVFESEQNIYAREGEDGEYVIVKDKNGHQTAVTVKTVMPQIAGAVIVCEGAASSAVRLRVTEAAAALLQLPVSNIKVYEMGK